MLCGAWSRSPDRWSERLSTVMGPGGPDSVWQDGPLVVLASGGAPNASEDDFVCYLEGGLSPPAGPPGSRPERTVADADTVLRTYRDAGAAGVSALRGQFSALVWDRRRTRLQLVCERLARQGWYVLERSGEILFATELRELLCVGSSSSRHGPSGVHDVAWRTGLSGGPHPVRGGLAARAGGVVCLLRRRARSTRALASDL